MERVSIPVLAELMLVQKLIGRRHLSQIEKESETLARAHAAILYKHKSARHLGWKASATRQSAKATF